jgi:hypothetical protein
VSVERRRHEPRRRGISVNDEFGSEVFVQVNGLALGLLDNRSLPLEDLNEQLLSRRHFLLLLLLLQRMAMKIHCERENQRERERFGMNGEDGVAFSADSDFKFWGK